MRSRLTSYALAAALLGAGLATTTNAAPTRAGDDAVVIAVIDDSMSPYHWDYLAAHMPQAKSKSKSDDLPLTKAPHTWLRGFPKPSAFAGYAPLNLTLDAKNPKAKQAALFERDEDKFGDVDRSSRDEVYYRWIPGTKVIGAISFGGGGVPVYGAGSPSHGAGTASASVGNIYGTCPECLLVFIQAGDYEAAIDWAMNQPWIDAISNSYGLSTTPVARDRVYGGADTALQKKATERGQTVFFSAGNGVFNDFVTPNGTLLSSQEGPDWIVTVGATDPTNNDYPGAGKPADVAGIGTLYPTSYQATEVTGGKNFGGTSNATPTLAGTYGRALHLARATLPGPSRVQAGGVIASGGRVVCGTARKDCELGDGRLTRTELQRRIFEGATPTSGGFAGRRTIPSTVAGIVPVPAPVGGMSIPFVALPAVADSRFLSEGYGTFRARLDGDAKWLKEFDRVWGPLRGTSAVPKRPAGEADYMRVDSWCRQHIWGSWQGGAYLSEAKTPLPLPDPLYPSRTAYRAGCLALQRPPG
jgi:hypothetical protein